MSESKIQFSFNTAITGLPEATGAWDEKAHRDAVLPLRGLVMQIDGVCGCHIARYGMTVDYVGGVASRDLVITGVKAAVMAVSDGKGLFPLRGEKKPAVTLEAPTIARHHTWWAARVDFDTDLFVDISEEATQAICNELKARLVDADGARNPGVGQRVLWVNFDPRITSSVDMEDHLRSVVREIMESRKEKKYFPFREPMFSYKTHETPYVI